MPYSPLHLQRPSARLQEEPRVQAAPCPHWMKMAAGGPDKLGGGYRGCALKHLKQHAKQPLPQPWQFDQNGLSHLFSRRQNSPIWFEPTHRFCSLLFLLNSLVHSEDHLQIEPRVPRGFMRQSARQECSLPCHISLWLSFIIILFNIPHILLC